MSCLAKTHPDVYNHDVNRGFALQNTSMNPFVKQPVGKVWRSFVLLHAMHVVQTGSKTLWYEQPFVLLGSEGESCLKRISELNNSLASSMLQSLKATHSDTTYSVKIGELQSKSSSLPPTHSHLVQHCLQTMWPESGWCHWSKYLPYLHLLAMSCVCITCPYRCTEKDCVWLYKRMHQILLPLCKLLYSWCLQQDSDYEF